MNKIKSINLIYEILYGSDAYGTTTNDSDNDIRGIYLPTLDESLSMQELHDIRKEDETEDRVMYPIQKFFKLAVKSNPSVFEWLFVPSQCIKIMKPEGKLIRDNRLLFLSKEIYKRFKGFAVSEFGAITKLTGKTGEKRKKQILKFGYSPKNAMNCIRLLEQGIELLDSANITMPRPNAKELVEIKMGKWDYKRITKTFDERLSYLDKIVHSSRLPDKPRYDDADKLLIRILKNE